ncbi:MAG: hypothetical protein R2712_09280 [Vicinamibacterales bacterium]
MFKSSLLIASLGLWQPLNAVPSLQPLTIASGSDVVEDTASVLLLGQVSDAQGLEARLLVTNQTADHVIVDAFVFGAEASAVWEKPEGLLTTSSTRVSLAPKASASLLIVLLPTSDPQRKMFPLVMLMSDYVVRNSIAVVFSPVSSEGGFSTDPQEIASGVGEDWAYYRVCTPPPPPGYSLFEVVPHLSGDGGRVCGDWASCDRVAAEEGEGACYRFGVQGIHENCFGCNDKVAHATVSVKVKWRLVRPTARLYEQEAFVESFRPKSLLKN